jgi:hypothetical protein
MKTHVLIAPWSMCGIQVLPLLELLALNPDFVNRIPYLSENNQQRLMNLALHSHQQ